MSDLLVYDDDCGFCTDSATMVADHSHLRIVGFSELTDDQRARLPDDFERCAHLVTDERVFSCGEAMARAYERTDLPLSGAMSTLRRVPGFAWARERGYRFVANHRAGVGRVFRALR